MTVEDYENEAILDLKLDISDFQGYVRLLGLKRIKWAKYLHTEEMTLTVAQDKLRDLYRERFHHYMYEYNDVKLEKKNVDIYIRGDKDYRAAEQIVAKQEAKVKFVNEVLNTIDKQSFSCSNILKHLIWQSGATA